MREEFEKAIAYGRSAWRFRYVALLSAWIVALVGWFVVFLIPNQYETTTRVFVDTNSLLRPLLEGIAVTPTASNQQADFVRRALLGRPQLERVIDTTDLRNRVRSTTDRENLLKDLMTDIRITANASGPGQREANIFAIAYADSDPELAFTVVKQLLETFVSQSLGANRTDANTAQRFLEEQIEDYERRLSESEARLADFKKKNIGSMPDERGGYFQRLQTDMTQLDNLSSSLAVATRKRDELRAKLLGSAGGAGAAGEPGVAMTETSVDARISEARTRLEDMLLRFTDRHPDVVALRETIDRLEAQRQTELEALRSNVGALGVARASDSLVVQNLQIALNQSEIEVSSLQAQVTDYQQRIDTLRSHINTLPEVEAQLAQLNRDYNVTRTEYERLLQRLESAKLSDAVDRVDEVRFKVIDPPVEELLPVKPKRALLVVAVAVGSVGGGILLAFLLSQLWPVFVFSRELLTYELPVLGVVSAATGNGISRIRSAFSTAAVVGLTASLFAVGVLLIVLRNRVESFSAHFW